MYNKYSNMYNKYSNMYNKYSNMYNKYSNMYNKYSNMYSSRIVYVYTCIYTCRIPAETYMYIYSTVLLEFVYFIVTSIIQLFCLATSNKLLL